MAFSKQIRLVQDVRSYEGKFIRSHRTGNSQKKKNFCFPNLGPYYECSSKVLSEFCVPILDEAQKQPLGIVDAESFKPNFFEIPKQLQILKVCFDLRKYL